MTNLAMMSRALVCALILCTTVPSRAAERSPDAEAVVAAVGSEKIRVAAIEAELDAKYDETEGDLDRDAPDERRAAVDRLIERRLFYLGTLDEIPGARAVADSVRHHEQIRATWRSLKRRLHPAPEAVTPDAIEQFRQERASAWHGRHILVNSEEEVAEALRQLERGVPFGDVARALSIDIGSAAIGGRLFPLRKGDWYPALMDLAFNLHPGDYGGPVTSRLGYHIMKCDSVLFAPEDPDVFTPYQLRVRLDRMAVFAGLDEVIDAHIEELGITTDPALVDSLLLHLQPVGNLTEPPRKDPSWDPPAGALATSSLGDTMTIDGYFEDYDVLLGYDWPVPHNRTSVMTSVERLMVAHVLRRKLVEGTFDPGPVARAEIDAVVHRHLGNMYFQRILDPGPIDSARAEQIFRGHPEAFEIPPQASIAMLGVSSAAFADSVEGWLASGMPIAAVGKRITAADEGAWYNRPTPLFFKGQFPDTDALIFSELEPGDLSPREPTPNGGYQYYHLTRREPARPAARLELSLDILMARSRNYLMERARDEHLEKLRARHPVEVVEGVLEDVLHAPL